MAHSKAALFQLPERNLSEYCKTLGHPARQRIIELLNQQHTVTFGELCEELPLGPTTIQDHLIRLQRAQLIRLGQSSTGQMGYQIEPLAQEEMLILLRNFIQRLAA